jgi:hypothetical protein
MRLPYDREVLLEFQGQTYTVVKDNGDPYGTAGKFGGGSFHTLDAAKIAVAAKHIPPLEEAGFVDDLVPDVAQQLAWGALVSKRSRRGRDRPHAAHRARLLGDGTGPADADDHRHERALHRAVRPPAPPRRPARVAQVRTSRSSGS